MPVSEKRKTAAKKARADTKGRIPLGTKAAGKKFSITHNQEGQIILTPLARIPEREAWLYENPEALALFRQGLADVAAGRVGKPQDFSQYADLNLDE